jgi:hypothetical protein
VDLYRYLGEPLPTLSAHFGTEDAYRQVDGHPGGPGTVITKVVETADEGRNGMLLHCFAP